MSGYKREGQISGEPRPFIQDALRTLLNQYDAEAASGTPDYILANYMLQCLEAYNIATRYRDRQYGLNLMDSVEDN